MTAAPGQFCRLDSRWYDDDKIILAGWEAAAVWGGVLARMKLHGGVLPAKECLPAVLSALLHMPLRVVSPAVLALRAVGLLVDGSRSVRGGDGGRHLVVGWVTPRWDAWQVEPGERPNPKQRREEACGGRAPGARGGNAPSHGEGTLTQETGDMRQNTPPPTPSTPPPPGAPPHRPPAAAAPEDEAEPRTDPGSLYRHLTGRSGFTIPPAQQARLLAICQRSSPDEVAERVSRASGADRPLGYFLALFEPDGTPKPSLRARGGDAPDNGDVAATEPEVHYRERKSEEDIRLDAVRAEATARAKAEWDAEQAAKVAS